MTDLDHYLAAHYLDEAGLAAAAGIERDELDCLIRGRLVPVPSYIVTVAGTVVSFVFGELPSPGSRPGRFFHPSQATWIERARSAIAAGGAPGAEARLKDQFSASFSGALAILDRTTWRLSDSFGPDGLPIEAGLRKRTVKAWEYFLNGTSGLCVANPVSGAHIAYKEVLQEKLTHLSENGARAVFQPEEAAAMLELIDAYAAAAMPFSPVEYARSSRKRLVDQLRADIRAANDVAA